MNLRTEFLYDKQQMLAQLDVLQGLYPSLTMAQYATELDLMLPHNYSQLAVFDQDECIAICGIWIGNKLWVGKYLELDNIVVKEAYRSRGVGDLIFKTLEQKAHQENCNMLSLDSYTSNFKAHKFFYNQGYSPKGFHFIKLLNEKAVR
ncbi:MAG: GNAT family N-acetyltransferase [Sphingomonadales bacterium]|jgi:GNAT superfamily N-acetyltransferase